MKNLPVLCLNEVKAFPLDRVPVEAAEKNLNPEPLASIWEPEPNPEDPLPIGSRVKSTVLIVAPFTVRRTTPESPSPKEYFG